MKKFEITVSKGMYKVWNVYFTVKAKTKEEAEAKALKLAEEYPEGKIREKNSEPIEWDECADDEPYKMQVEDSQEITKDE